MKFFVLALFILVFLRPHPTFVDERTAVYLGDFSIVFFFLLSFLIIGKLRHINLRKLAYLDVGFFCLTILFFINLYHSEAGVTIELGKIIYYLLFVFAMLYLFSTHTTLAARSFNKSLDTMIIPISAIAIVQFFEIPIANDLVLTIWGDEKLRGISTDSPRIFSTFFNANWFGTVIAMILVTYVRRLLRYGLFNSKNLFMIILCLCLLIGSGSRTGFLALMMGLVLLFGEHLYAIEGKARITFLLTLGALIICGGAVAIALWPTISGYQRVYEVIAFFSSGDPSVIPSVSARLDQWQLAISAIALNPLFGIGETGKDLQPHNSFLFMLLLFGVAGSLTIILLFSCLLSILARSLHGSIFLIRPLIGLLLISALTAEFLFTTQVMLSFILITVCWFEDSGSFQQNNKQVK